jgi:hypothetical protein
MTLDEVLIADPVGSRVGRWSYRDKGSKRRPAAVDVLVWLNQFHPQTVFTSYFYPRNLEIEPEAPLAETAPLPHIAAWIGLDIGAFMGALLLDLVRFNRAVPAESQVKVPVGLLINKGLQVDLRDSVRAMGVESASWERAATFFGLPEPSQYRDYAVHKNALLDLNLSAVIANNLGLLEKEHVRNA